MPQSWQLAESQTRTLLRRLLKLNRDFEITGAFSNSDEALAAVASIGVDVVVSDIQMPGLSGLDLARRLRTRRRHCACAGFVPEALRLGIAGYLLKDPHPKS